MAMTLTQLEMKRSEYGTMFDVEFQQLRERVRPYTTTKTGLTGDRYEMPGIGGTEMREYTGTRKKIDFDDIRFGKRSMFYRKFYNAIPISEDEVADMKNLDYTFGRVKTLQLAAAARMFDAIALGVIYDSGTKAWRLKTAGDGGYCGGILGTNYSGDGGTVTNDLDLTYASYKAGTGNLVPVDYATTGTGVDKAFAGTILDKLFYVRRRLEELEAFDASEKGSICMCISPAIKQLLCSLEMKHNKDYGFSQLGEAGESCYNSYTNITFVVTNMLPTMNTENKSGEAINNARMCCAWLKNRVEFGIWQGTEFKLKDINDQVDVDFYLRAKGRAGCARKDDTTVFVIPTVENLTA